MQRYLFVRARPIMPARNRVKSATFSLSTGIELRRPQYVALVFSPILGLYFYMRVIAVSRLKAFWNADPRYLDAEEPTLAWYRDILKADWAKPSDLKAQFRSASILKDGRAVFNVAGNKYRIVVWINYPYRVVYIRFIGTHKQYDEIDGQTI